MSSTVEFLKREAKKQGFRLRLSNVQFTDVLIGEAGADRELSRSVYAAGLFQPRWGLITVAGRSIWDLPIGVTICFFEVGTGMGWKEPPGVIKFHDSYEFAGKTESARLELLITLPDTFRERFIAPMPRVAIDVTVDGFDEVEPEGKNWDSKRKTALHVIRCAVINDVEEVDSAPQANRRSEGDILEGIEANVASLIKAIDERLLRWEKYATVAFFVFLIVLIWTRR